MDLDHVIGLIDGKAARPVDAAHASGGGCGVRAGFPDPLAAAVRLHRNRVVQHMHVDLARVAARGRWNHDALCATGGGKTAHDNSCARKGEYGFHDCSSSMSGRIARLRFRLVQADGAVEALKFELGAALADSPGPRAAA